MEAEWTKVSSHCLCRDAEDRILLTRFASPSHPDSGKWTLPGGGIEWGESPRDALHRELLEETGLVAVPTSIAGVFSRWFSPDESYQGKSGLFVSIIFRTDHPKGQLRSEFDHLNTTDGVAWFDIEQVRHTPHVELVDFALQLPDSDYR